MEVGCSSTELRDAVRKWQVLKHWRKSEMGRRNECIKRKEKLNDYGRFKLYFLQRAFKKEVAKEIMKMRACVTGKSVQQLRSNSVRMSGTIPCVRRIGGKRKKRLAAKKLSQAIRAKKAGREMAGRIEKIQMRSRKMRKAQRKHM